MVENANPVTAHEIPAGHGRADLEIVPPVAAKGDAITLRAERDLVLVLSSCPMDIAPTNGPDRTVKPVSVAISASPK